MNQILSVEPPNGRKKKISSINSILIVFAIILMIFGIGITTSGAYSYYKNLSNDSDTKQGITSNTKPLITIERESATMINIVVVHDKEIANVEYTINNGDKVTKSGDGKTELKIEVKLPTGSSTINIIAQDINGVFSSYESSIEAEQKPSIELEQIENKIQITVESSINIDYISYYWDNDDENAQKYTINDTKTETLVEVLEGNHDLNIVAVDIEGNENKKTQTIIGDTKPELNVTSDGKKFVINASDDEELTKIEYKLNSNEVISKEINNTEYSEMIDLEDGVNKLMVKIYNKNGLTETAKVKYTKE